MTEQAEAGGSSGREEWLASVPEEFDDAFWKTLTLKHLIWLEGADLNEQQREFFDTHKPKVDVTGLTGTKKLNEALSRFSENFAPLVRNMPTFEKAKGFEWPDVTGAAEKGDESWSEVVALQARARAAEVARQQAMVDALQGVQEELINQGVSAKHGDAVQHTVLVVSVLALMVAVGIPVATETRGFWTPAIAVLAAAVGGLLIAYLLGVFRRRA